MMAETEGSLADDRELMIGREGGVVAAKSPWKTTASPPETVDAPVMGADSWPALADAAQQPRPKNPPPPAPPSKSIPSATPTPAQDLSLSPIQTEL